MAWNSLQNSRLLSANHIGNELDKGKPRIVYPRFKKIAFNASVMLSVQ